MQTQIINRRLRVACRRGMAPLEFTMALPVLLLLMVAITWLGFSVIGQTEVLVEARNKAWQRRFENVSKKPLIFPLKATLPGMPEYSQAGDFVTERASKKVNVSPIFSRVPGPEAGHSVLAGSWDWRAMPFTDPPNWDLIVIAGVNGSAGKYQNLFSQLNGDLMAEALKKVAKEMLKQAIEDATKDKPELKAVLEGIDSYDGDWKGLVEKIMQQILKDAVKDNKVVASILDELGVLKDDGSSTGSKATNTANSQNATNSEQQKRDAAHADELNAVLADIKATQEQLDQLDPFANSPIPTQQPPPLNEEQRKAQEIKKQQIEFLKDKLKRLKTAAHDIQSGPDLNSPLD